MYSLNLAKGLWPVIVLPLMGEASRLHKHSADMDFPTFKRRFTWVYNALSNVMVMTSAFKMRNSRNAIFDQVNPWTTEKKREFLEAQRTGSYLRVIDQEVIAKPLKKLFKYRKSAWSKKEDVNWAKVYKKLQRTAELNGDLSASEFEFYLTIFYQGKRIFFPYHVLCRSQVLLVGWSWDIIYSICCHVAETTTKQCNKHGEKAGLGENLDGLKVMYGLAATISKLIKEVKRKWRNASPEEIAFRIVECFGYPMVPFVNHPLAMSVGHLVHGTAMLYGFTNGDDEFDPERHIDLSRCTISVETQFTNRVKHNFHNDYFPDIQEYLCKIPTQNSHYRVDPEMGNTIWPLNLANASEPLPPVPEFEIELLPIDQWVPDDSKGQDSPLCVPGFSCQQCGKWEPSAGALIHHHRHEHSPVDPTDPVNADQDAIDAAYWDSLTCQTCGKWFLRYSILDEHVKIHRPYEERDLICSTCGMAFNYPHQLQAHMTTHLPEEARRIHDCIICGKSFFRAEHLSIHQLLHMTDDEKEWFKCCFCDKEFDRKRTRDTHEVEQHVNADIKYECPEFHGLYNTEGSLQSHIRNQHSGERERPFVCEICGNGFYEQRILDRHIAQVHEGQQNYVCKDNGCGCGQKFGQKSSLTRHIKRSVAAQKKKEDEGDQEFMCDSDDCDKSYALESSLIRHKKKRREAREGTVNKLVCDSCGKTYDKKKWLDTHKKHVDNPRRPRNKDILLKMRNESVAPCESSRIKEGLNDFAY